MLYETRSRPTWLPIPLAAIEAGHHRVAAPGRRRHPVVTGAFAPRRRGDVRLPGRPGTDRGILPDQEDIHRETTTHHTARGPVVTPAGLLGVDGLDGVLGLVQRPDGPTLGVTLAVLFLGVLVEGPVVSVVAGSLAGAGLLDWWVVWLVAFAADVVADTVFYVLGRGGRRPGIAPLLVRLGLTADRREVLRAKVGAIRAGWCWARNWWTSARSPRSWPSAWPGCRTGGSWPGWSR